MAHKLLLLTQDNDKYRQLLSLCQLPELTILGDDPSSICEADIWFAEPQLAAPLLNLGSELKWMQSTFAGVDKLTGSRQRRDYALTNIKGIFGPLMSEYLFGYLLAHQREHAKYKQQQQQQQWAPGNFRTLQGQHLLLLGTGSIAQHIAQTAKHFGMTVTGLSKSAVSKPYFDHIDTIEQLATYLPKAQAIASILPSTLDTENLLNADMLAMLPPESVLFNLGRGNVLDLDALAKQLKKQSKQHAVLDVFNQEPLSSEHPIWQCPNAIITPHIAAPSFPEQVVEVFADNYRLWRQQHPLKHQVDFIKGY
ncbi:dihydrofolate reductase [Shewanella sp. UCD-FRSSP16_17]|uniref:D-2-hydroxyacid dehydrogenase n=1 Tax=unclassified Shewanella TaxID=196818 RepID=UPI0007EEAF94|nr:MULTISPECIES: D-2-hydroxyacid dehydrogenase [unclassified Shewanella]MBQ4889477.1 D-2-hydroxyacid dehydrogenase [Shewanella sp. MMG014]OBT08245.1 dihydrofolate reductase [Shewanella sp. UCD-FRSSP16_17]